MRVEAGRRGLEVEIDSAGTGNWHIGNPPDRRAQAAALRQGIDISHLRARQFMPADHTRFTHILALDGENLADIRMLAPRNATARVSLLLDHVEGREGQPVADPFWGEDTDFDRTWHEVSEAAKALAEKLSARQ